MDSQQPHGDSKTINIATRTRANKLRQCGTTTHRHTMFCNMSFKRKLNTISHHLDYNSEHMSQDMTETAPHHVPKKYCQNETTTSIAP